MVDGVTIDCKGQFSALGTVSWLLVGWSPSMLKTLEKAEDFTMATWTIVYEVYYVFHGNMRNNQWICGVPYVHSDSDKPKCSQKTLQTG